MKLKRYDANPILSPNPENEWESLVTTNPAAWYDAEQNKVFMLYRAAGNDKEHIVSLGLAESNNGFDFKRCSDSPVLAPLEGGLDGGAIEDPRIVKFGEWYYVTYAARPLPNGKYWGGPEKRTYQAELSTDLPAPFNTNNMTTCLAFTKDFKNWIRAGLMTDPNIHDHDVVIFPEKINDKFIILHRPDFSNGENLGIHICETESPLRIANSKLLAMPAQEWEGWKIGVNGPPIKTEAGWLLFYHGVSTDRFYRLGAMLLDIEDPGKVIARSPKPVFEPEEWYELEGCHNYNGVVFPCGNVIINGKLIIYYGGADKYIGAAYCNLDEIINYLLGE